MIDCSKFNKNNFYTSSSLKTITWHTFYKKSKKKNLRVKVAKNETIHMNETLWKHTLMASIFAKWLSHIRIFRRPFLASHRQPSEAFRILPASSCTDPNTSSTRDEHRQSTVGRRALWLHNSFGSGERLSPTGTTLGGARPNHTPLWGTQFTPHKCAYGVDVVCVCADDDAGSKFGTILWRGDETRA